MKLISNLYNDYAGTLSGCSTRVWKLQNAPSGTAIRTYNTNDTTNGNDILILAADM